MLIYLDIYQFLTKHHSSVHQSKAIYQCVPIFAHLQVEFKKTFSQQKQQVIIKYKWIWEGHCFFNYFLCFIYFVVESNSQFALLSAGNFRSTSKFMINKETLKNIDVPFALHILNQIASFVVFFTVIHDRIRKAETNWTG